MKFTIELEDEDKALYAMGGLHTEQMMRMIHEEFHACWMSGNSAGTGYRWTDDQREIYHDLKSRLNSISRKYLLDLMKENT